MDPDQQNWARLLPDLFQAHPWHGVYIGDDAPARVVTYIEMVPTDTVKYELDKPTGLLRIDRPQRYSNVCPALYGFVPQTLCGDHFARHCAEAEGRAPLQGDDDPLDICVLTEKAVSHGDILLVAIPIGGLRMIDGDECDDKIVAVLEGDSSYGAWTDIADCPSLLVERLRHYFLTYKQSPDSTTHGCKITQVYGRSEAHDVVAHCRHDYRDRHGDLLAALQRLREP